MNALVTGGLGFIGSNLVDYLVSQDQNVFVWDDLSSDSASPDYMNPKATYVIADVRRINEAKHPKYDVIYHLAAHARIQPSFEDPLECLSNDIMGVAAVCDLARKQGTRVVYSSTSSSIGGANVFGSPYTFAKTQGEEICKMYNVIYGVSTVTATFFNVYGPRQPITGEWATVIGLFEELTKQGKPLTIVGNGEQKRDFTHIDDIVSGLFELGWKDWTRQQFNLGTGTNYSINQLAAMFGGKSVRIPCRKGDVMETLADPYLMHHTTGWQAKQSLPAYIEDWKAANM